MIWTEAHAHYPRGYYSSSYWGRSVYIPPSPEAVERAERVSRRLDELRAKGCRLMMNEAYDVAIQVRDGSRGVEMMVTQSLLGSENDPVPRILSMIDAKFKLEVWKDGRDG